MTSSVDKEDTFLILMPGRRVARLPVAVLERFIDATARLSHDLGEAESDVTAHSMSVDPATGTSSWHTEWELGYCDYTDESGFPQSAYLWHRHPLGTEYTEIYQK